MILEGKFARCPARAAAVLLTAVWATAILSTPAVAIDYAGTVDFQGDVVFAAPIPGIDPEDLTISVKIETEPTGQATKCSITGTTSDSADLTGNYPDTGGVDAAYFVERGGPNLVLSQNPDDGNLSRSNGLRPRSMNG